MITVEEILQRKADPAVITINAATSVFQAMQVMAEKQIGALLVVDGNKVQGILTERDYARKIALENRKSRSTPVRDIMSSPVVHVSPAETSEDCIALMGRHRIRHLPVLDEGRVIGMISMRDLIDEIIADRSFLVHQLEAAVRERSSTRATAAGKAPGH